ncbi:MAG TPA: hypothetical protein VN372_02825 [Methanospirillum sp.]|nr:hypothetical protein [Methanospirillum sp.]
MAEILIYLGSILAMIWGIAHIFPGKSVVSGFGQISEDNKKIILMEWLSEGLTFLYWQHFNSCGKTKWIE